MGYAGPLQLASLDSSVIPDMDQNCSAYLRITSQHCSLVKRLNHISKTRHICERMADLKMDLDKLLTYLDPS